MNDDAAERLLAKLRRFVAEELDPEERAMLASLLAPAVARVWGGDEVEGYGLADWSPEALPEALRDALRRGAVRIVGLELFPQPAATALGEA